MLSTRVLSAVILIPLVAGAVYLGGPWFAGLVAAFAVLGVIEFYQIAGRLGAHPSVAVGATLTAVLVLSAQFPTHRIGPAAFVGVLAALMLLRVLRQNHDDFLLDWGATVAGSAYVGGMVSHFVLLRGLPRGLTWVALAVVTTWIADTAAYVVGTTWGRRPFYPRISPRKTTEGAIAGVVAGTLLVLGAGVPLLGLSWPQAAALGIILSLAITYGDLAESLIKRQASVKDSGNLIPGHGGALDRLDSLLFAAVVTYYFAVWVVRM